MSVQAQKQCTYLNVGWKPWSLVVNHGHSQDGLGQQGNEGVDSQHQGRGFHAEINGDLKSDIVQMGRVLKEHICGLLNTEQ